MGIKTVQENSLHHRHINELEEYIDTEWVRNPSWLTLPEVSASEQKFVGLYSVTPDSSFATVQCFTSGQYAVNWGDGLVEVFTSGSIAYHMYDYNSATLIGTEAPVSFSSTTSTVERNNHGYPNDYEIVFDGASGTPEVTAGYRYYVVNKTVNSFQISLTKNGTPLTFTVDGSGWILPYRQSIVTVTPSGGNITYLTLLAKHNQTGLNNQYVTGWRDINVSLPNTNTLAISTNSPTIYQSNLERINIVNFGNVTSTSYMFYECRALRSVKISDTSKVTNMTGMFYGCNSIKNIPMMNTANVTDITNMFYNCSSVKSIPPLNTAKVTNMISTFYNCTSLEMLPFLNTGAVINLTNTFIYCSSLKTLPLFDFKNVTTMSNTFNGCSSLESIPAFNTSKVTNMVSTFYGCVKLHSIPYIPTNLVTTMSQMFYGCLSLKQVPAFNTPVLTDTSSMFYNCQSLVEVPLFDTSNVTTMSQMFYGCVSLLKVPSFNTAKVLLMDYMFSTCSSIEYIPLFNTPLLTNCSYMFYNCKSLKQVPAFNTSSVTIFSSMFFSCYNLEKLPAFNLNSGTTVGVFCDTCPSLSDINSYNHKATFSVARCKLSKKALEKIFGNILRVTTANTISLTTNWGNPAAVSLSGIATAGSAVVNIANTTNLSIGMWINGTGFFTAVPVTLQDVGDTITRTNHGLLNDMIVSFSSIVGTTGLLSNTIYYVVNATPNTFQISDVSGGTPLTLTTDGTANIIYPVFITNIVPNTNITLSVPSTSTGTFTYAFRTLKAYIPVMKGWTVTY